MSIGQKVEIFGVYIFSIISQTRYYYDNLKRPRSVIMIEVII